MSPSAAGLIGNGSLISQRSASWSRQELQHVEVGNEESDRIADEGWEKDFAELRAKIEAKQTDSQLSAGGQQATSDAP